LKKKQLNHGRTTPPMASLFFPEQTGLLLDFNKAALPSDSIDYVS
jgi:hypothetical protein